MEYYNNILCVEVGWLIDEQILSKSNYDALKRRGWLEQLRRATTGTPALISYASIPERFKAKIIDVLGCDPTEDQTTKDYFTESIKPDMQAFEYFNSYQLEDGRFLPEDTITEYYHNTIILNATILLINQVRGRRKSSSGMGAVWKNTIAKIQTLENYKHTLPKNVRRFRDKLNVYTNEGYDGLIHKGYLNNNRRKVTVDIEQLLLAIYAMPNKPYAKSVHDIYLQFLAGAIDVPNIKTGELYERDDFYGKDGRPIVVSDTTVWNYLNDAKNKAVVSKVRSGSLEFMSTHRPHHHRHAPEYSLSKISMDDRDLPRKMADGNRVKAYYSYDIASTAIVGASYSKLKDKELFIECMRDMFRNLHNWELGVPMEPEVEHHLVNKFKDDLMKAGIVFPFVRWCLPGNSQEKYAEQLNKQKKYGYEKKYQIGIGRFYAKLEANSPKVDKISDEHNNNYNDRRYSYDQLVADDRETIEAYNNDLHPNQDLYTGMTRLEVLINFQNPNLANIDNALLARYIGNKTETSIRRSQYVRVQYANYQLSTPEDLGKLNPNNYDVDAYYIPDVDGKIDTVYIYQNEKYVSRCDKIITYNTATAEQTEADREAYVNQAKYVSKFDKMIKDNKPEKVAIIENTPQSYEAPETETVEPIALDDTPVDTTDWDSLVNDDDYMTNKGFNEL